MNIDEYDVVIAGGGPVGVTAAHLLGRYGIRTLVLERDEASYTYPRVASVDEEALRIFQAIGLIESLFPEMRAIKPALELMARGGRMLVRMDRESQPYGYPVAVTILQHRLEETLRAQLSRHACVELRLGHTVERFEQDTSGITVDVSAGGEARRVRGRYLLGCDGARSTVRRLCNVPLEGDTAPEAWLVVDTQVEEPKASTIRMYGTADRAMACVPLPGRYHRWELRLRPDDDLARMESLTAEEVRDLIFQASGEREIGKVVRQRVYKQHTRIASRFQDGRVFLLGDAAHLMPPFAGQGLCSGLRDADNLCWKLAAVLRGRIDARVLETYEAERRRHAAATVESSARLGGILFPRTRLGEAMRDVLVPALMLIPPLRRLLTEGRLVKPLPVTGRGGLRVGQAPAGSLFIQPRVRQHLQEPVLLDDVLGPSFAWIAYGRDPRELLSTQVLELWDSQEARYLQVSPAGEPAPSSTGPNRSVVIEDVQGALAAWFAEHRVDVVLVRPDHYVAAACRADAIPSVNAQVMALLAPRPAKLPRLPRAARAAGIRA